MKILTIREKAIICGLFLSKFDSEGLTKLGFTTFKEAFNVLGLAIHSKPASIKNYRDELDPLFPNARRGWHKRELRGHCQKIYEIYRDYDLEDMAFLVSNITHCSLTSNIEEKDSESESFAKRLLTGRAAENFFLVNYRDEPEFALSDVIDVTQSGCGFDFRMQYNGTSAFEAVEVKGIRQEAGRISLTSKEHSIADIFGNRYYLYIVKNFDEKPYAVKYRNPLRTGIAFDRIERKITQISWSTKL